MNTLHPPEEKPTAPYEKLVAVLILLAFFLLASHMSYEDEKLLQTDRCLSVLQWELDKVRKIPPEQRKGYPAKNAQQHQECMG